jgi:hypothetical protein
MRSGVSASTTRPVVQRSAENGPGDPGSRPGSYIVNNGPGQFTMSQVKCEGIQERQTTFGTNFALSQRQPSVSPPEVAERAGLAFADVSSLATFFPENFLRQGTT